MANIDPYIEQIANARYGKDVRDAIVNALNAINTEHHDNNVTSFNTRTGDVLPVNGDYNINQISSQGGLDGQIPVANSNGGFTLRTMHGEIDTLGQLDDVAISNPVNGQLLKYNNGEWGNANDEGGATLILQEQQGQNEDISVFLTRVHSRLNAIVNGRAGVPLYMTVSTGTYNAGGTYTLICSCYASGAFIFSNFYAYESDWTPYRTSNYHVILKDVGSKSYIQSIKETSSSDKSLKIDYSNFLTNFSDAIISIYELK